MPCASLAWCRVHLMRGAVCIFCPLSHMIPTGAVLMLSEMVMMIDHGLSTGAQKCKNYPNPV